MPNRIIKESICTSENIDMLTPFEETVFVRLMVNCDDFGRFDGRPKILSSRLFPLRDITAEEMSKAMDALVKAGLVVAYTVNDKPFVQMATWGRHQQTRACKSKYPAPEDGVVTAKDSNGNQLISDDSKCPRNRNRESINDIRESSSLIGDDEAVEIVREQDKVISAAETAGFAKNDATRAKIVALYADHGMKKMLDGIDSCVEHGVCNIAYLSAVLNGSPRRKKESGGYTQRDYAGEQDEAMKNMIARMMEDGS